MAVTPHEWQFFRAGGLDQVMIRDGADIGHLHELDQKLWVALACPTHGIEIDPATLDFIDTDRDGRIRVPEVLAAIHWLKEVRKDLDDLLRGGDSIPLSEINDRTPAGAALLVGVRHILQNLGKGGADRISLSDITDAARILAATPFNGDGVVPPESAAGEALRQALRDIMAVHGSAPDRSGQPGLDRARADAFFTEAAALDAWHARAEHDPAILPLGEATAAAAAAVAAVEAKVDDYFTRCRLAALEPRAATVLSGTDAELAALAARELSSRSEEVARLPIARIEPGRPLPLSDGVNPAWAGALAELSRAAVGPLLGGQRTSLGEADWAALLGRLAAHRAWLAERPQTSLEPLGITRVRELLGLKEAVYALLQQDEALAGEFAQLEAVAKLLHLQRDLVTLLRNFVNFSAFYKGEGAAFQAGTLYLDGRSCELCVHVEDSAAHAKLAGLAKAYLAYCECRRAGGERMTIAAAFTDGDSDHLMVGRNGVFYDRKGRDWDATITQVIENPISVRQAFWAPYKGFVRMVEQYVATRAARAEAEAGARLKAAAETMATSDQTRPTGGRPEPRRIDVGTVAALGVAVGGIATFLSGLLATFFGLGWWMPLGVAALVLAISGPYMLVAWLKLRQRSLGPILDACGWAVNGRVRITVPFGGVLTSLAALPRGAARALRDPYAERRGPWRTYLVLALLGGVAVAWWLGSLDPYLPPGARSVAVLGERAPAYRQPPPPPGARDQR